MKSLLLLALLAFGLAVQATASVETRLRLLDKLVHLSPEQSAQIADSIRREEAVLAVPLQSQSPGRAFQAMDTCREEIRHVLTPDQRQRFDHTASDEGGGFGEPRPEFQVRRLAADVSLTPAQASVALQVYTEEYEALRALAPEDRSSKGQRYRDAARDQIRALMTAEQLERQDDQKAAQQARSDAESAAAEKAVRECRGLGARIGPLVQLQRAGGSARSDRVTRSGEIRFQATGQNGSEFVIVSWRRKPASAPVEITKIADSRGEVFQP